MAMDELFVNRRCYLKFGNGTVLHGIRLCTDCFFGRWPLKNACLDDEGCIQVEAYARQADPGQVAEVLLLIDPVTGLLLEYRYMDHKGPKVFVLADGEYFERAVTRKEGSGEGATGR